MPNSEFADRVGLGCFKKLILKCFGRGNDKMADRKNQRYYFLFVESNGEQLAQISRIFEENKIGCSIDEIFDLNDVNQALQKVLRGGSKGKTLLKIDDTENNIIDLFLLILILLVTNLMINDNYKSKLELKIFYFK